MPIWCKAGRRSWSTRQRAGDETRILAAMAQAGVTPYDLALILLTHGHGDHAGSAAALTSETGVPVALHLPTWGKSRPGATTASTPPGWRRASSALLWTNPFPRSRLPCCWTMGCRSSISASIWVRMRTCCPRRGTPGFVALILPDQGDAIVGDVLMGGWMGGTLRPSRPNVHYFVDDAVSLQTSLDRLLAMTCVRWHGTRRPAPPRRRRGHYKQARLRKRIRDIHTEPR
ncbi:MAG: MBL fold metallo-hydrolase [Caldilineaceae bacterium]